MIPFYPPDDAQEVHSLLATYELLLKWQQRVLNRTGDGSDGNVDFNRRLRLLAALKARATDLLVDASGGFGRWSGEEPMVGLCLGQVMPQEVLMQYDSKAKKAKKASCSQEDWESKENEDSVSRGGDVLRVSEHTVLAKIFWEFRRLLNVILAKMLAKRDDWHRNQLKYAWSNRFPNIMR